MDATGARTISAGSYPRACTVSNGDTELTEFMRFSSSAKTGQVDLAHLEMLSAHTHADTHKGHKCALYYSYF